MGQFEIRDDAVPGDSPFADPAQWLPDSPL
jgi:hypothetical protein